MKAVIVALALSSATAFQATTPCIRPATDSGLRAVRHDAEGGRRSRAKEKKAKTNLGAGGTRGLEQIADSFVKALEKGEATHLYAVNPEEVRKGNIALKDVPYMQRGGSWDNSDLKGRAGWMKTASA